MVRKTTFIAVALFFILTYWLIHIVFSTNLDDKKKINDLVDNSNKRKKIHCDIQQKRKNVQKDIYFNINQERYHSKIVSLASDVNLEVTNKKIRATEMLYNIEFWMQEKITQSSQKIKYCSAQYGKYFFPSHQFISDEVSLTCFHSSGNKLADFFDANEILMKATAKHVFFQLNTTGANFRADHIKINLPETLTKEIKPKIFNVKNRKSQEKL